MSSRRGDRTLFRVPPQCQSRTERIVPDRQLLDRGSQFEFLPTREHIRVEYDRALFFADYSRDCIWAMLRGVSGVPAPGQIRTFVAGAANPVNLQAGPGGDLFYVDFDGGTIRRISYTAGNQAPTALATATPTSRRAPLTVNFDGSASSDPDGDPITYAWDLDGDGALDDSTAPSPSYTYTPRAPHSPVEGDRFIGASDRLRHHYRRKYRPHRHDQHSDRRNNLESR